jgi:hypothetical protein
MKSIPFVQPEYRLIEDTKQNLLFILLFNKDRVFLDFAYTNLKNKDLIMPHMPFHLADNHGKSYCISSVSYLSMHEIVFGRKAPKGYKIDHDNSNGLDNRIENLRLNTDGGNSHNRIKKEGTTSKYYGVCLTSYGKWRSSIVFKGETYHLGEYDDEEEAVKIHDIYAVYFYRDFARINNKNGIYFITKEEVEDIYKNGIPEKYKRIKRGEDRDLPQCIYNKGENWFYVKKYDHVKYRKSFRTREEAEQGLADLIAEMDEKERKRKEEIENNIIRNNEGVAILYTRDNVGNINGEWPVEDFVWRKFIHYNWSLHGEYAHSYVDGVVADLHIHTYTHFVGPIPDGMSVDHVNSKDKKDTRLANLRLANRSLQTHNTIREKKSCSRYKGISIVEGKFSLKFCAKYIGSYYYEEDAVLEYNRLSKEKYGENATLIEIPEIKTETTVADYFSDLSIEFLESLDTVGEIRQVFITKSYWGEKYSIINKETINSDNYKEYRALAIKLRTEEIETGYQEEKILLKEISLEYIQSIKTVKALRNVFRDREEWRKAYDVYYHHITSESFEKFKNLAIKLKIKETTNILKPNINFKTIVCRIGEGEEEKVKIATAEDIKNIPLPKIENLPITPMKALSQIKLETNTSKPRLVLKIVSN